jgi:predicted small lipoprotein YifL
MRSWTALAIALALVACGVKAPPRPPTASGKDVPETQVVR